MNANNNGVVKTTSSAHYGSIRHEATHRSSSLMRGKSQLRWLVTFTLLALLSLCTNGFASGSVQTIYASSTADAVPVVQAQPFDFQSIDAFVNSQMRAMHIPGVALGIVDGDEI